MTSRQALIIFTLWGPLAISSCTPNETAVREEKEPIEAQSQVIVLTEIPTYFEVPGSIRPRNSTVLSSRSIGTILRVNVREGDRVRQGTLLVEIDSRETEARLRQAEAATSAAQRGREEAESAILSAEATLRSTETAVNLTAATLKRYELLRERRSVSPQEFDETETRHKTAQQQTERAREDLKAAQTRRLQLLARIEQAQAETEAAAVAQEYSRIVSPIDGIVTKRMAEPGMLATPGSPLFALEDPRSYELEVSVEESRIGTIRQNATVRIEVDALGGAAMEGRVSEISPTSDPAGRTYSVKLQFVRVPAGTALRSGYFGRAIFPDSPRKALVIPPSALVRRGQLEGVYVIDDGRALFRLVKTGRETEQGIEILSGITDGTRILTSPPSQIADGVRVTP